MSLLSLILLATQDSISSDVRLTKPTSIDAPLMPIRSLLQNAEKASGIQFSCSPSIKDLKIDVFVDDEPLNQTLAKVAEACNLQWVRGADGYQLVGDDQADAEARQYVSAEDKLATQNLDRMITVYREIARIVPPSDERINDPDRFNLYKGDLKKAQAQLAKARADNASDAELEPLDIRVRALEEIASGTANLELARLFSQMSEGDIRAYKAGLPFIVSSVTKAKFAFSLGDLDPSRPNVDGKYVLFTCVDPATKRIGKKDFTFTPNQRIISGEPPGHYPFDDMPKELDGLSFAASLKRWDQFSALDDMFPTKIDEKSAEKANFDSPWDNGRYRLGDHLRWFHRMSGVPVVAMADRTVHPFVRQNRHSATEGQYLTSLLAACKGYAHRSGDFLLVRDGIYWRKELNEIPESTYAIVENPQRGNESKMDRYVAFSSKLNPLQAMLVQDRDGVVVQFSRREFAQTFPALQLVATLDDGELGQANRPGGLSFNRLSQRQQGLFEAAIVNGIGDQGFVSESLMDSFIYDGYDSQSLNAMRFHMSTMKMKVINQPVTVQDLGEQIVVDPGNEKVCGTIHYEFGYDGEKVVTFMSEQI
ncbi:MAG: hypothetical protein GC165_01615 [Armatimonadetes bacterium]|nr:hypothetical protein [Armatimonadota bacterium]